MRQMEVDRNGLEVPSREECLALVRQAIIGRLAINSRALPSIVPVNFVLTDFGVVIRTAPGSKLNNAIENAVVAFEVDEVDPYRHTGWSVVITGVAREITDPDVLEVVRHLPLAHWAPGPAHRYLCVALDLISGRRINPRPAAAATAAFFSANDGGCFGPATSGTEAS
jgi:hypothetical protein